MTKATQVERDLVARLLAHERAAASDQRAAANRVFEKTFAELTPVVGDRGVIAIFARSVVVARTECPMLATLVITLDSIETVGANVRDHLAAVDETQVTECAVTLWATFIALMSRLVGQDLTLQLLQRGWPAVDMKESP